MKCDFIRTFCHFGVCDNGFDPNIIINIKRKGKDIGKRLKKYFFAIVGN